jgi:hypothetical protein
MAGYKLEIHHSISVLLNAALDGVLFCFHANQSDK